ncbi:histidine phosphatase family protein [Microbacterium sp.]|uniref:histidine phosphatase family protein n=1 Tax=Microbacterium sp. TaxID=51671 RepID=UPI0039E2B11A
MKRIIPRIALATAVVLGATALGGWTAPSQAPSSSDVATHRDTDRDTTVTIYLTRHGQTLLNTLERVQGWTDSPLVVGTNADGSVLDARILPKTVGTNLRAREGAFASAYSADMKRHNETASYILQGAGQSKLTVGQDSRLRELNFGKYEGAENKEMWTEIVEHMGYTVDHDAAAQAPADANRQNGGWQTMQGIAIADQGLVAMMAAMKEIAQEPTDTGIVLPAEDCTDASTRAMAALNDIAKKAVKQKEARVLVVSSGLTITCVIDSLGTTVTSGISNVAVSKLTYKNGAWTVVSVGDTSYRQ